MTPTFYTVDPPAGGIAYASPDDLRDALGVDDTALPDSAAEDILEDASDWVDSRLGARPVDPVTGRKVTEVEVQPWQWAKVVRATVKVAGKLYREPDTFTRPVYDSVSGPDFSMSGRSTPLAAAMFGSDVVQLIDQSRLAVTSGRAR